MTVTERMFNELSKQGKTIASLCDSLGVKSNVVANWKTSSPYPPAKYLLIISEFLGVSIDYLFTGNEQLKEIAPSSYDAEERKLMHAFSQLNEANRHFIIGRTLYRLGEQERQEKWDEEHQDIIAEMLRRATVNSNNEDDEQTVTAVFKSLPRYSIRPSAGTGSFLDSSDYELIELPVDQVPIQATFCVSINGDSMLPDYQDEDIVFVKQQPTIEHNEVGIFLLNGEVYFKKYWIEGELKFLYSRNINYEPIPIEEHDELRVIGKVIGKYVEPKPIDLELAFQPYPPSMDKFVEWFDARAAAANAGIKPEKWSDEDIVKPGDPEYNMPISWAAQGGHVDEAAYERVADGLRLFEKKARLANEKGAQKKKKKKNADEE